MPSCAPVPPPHCILWEHNTNILVYFYIFSSYPSRLMPFLSFFPLCFKVLLTVRFRAKANFCAKIRKCLQIQRNSAFLRENEFCRSRVSTKWLNLLRKICAIFAQIFFFANFCAWNAMSFARFCAIFFCAICAKPEIFFAKCCAWNEILVLRIFFAQNRKFYAKCNFLGKL